MVAMRRVVTNPDLRRLEIAWTLATAAQWSLVVALLVYAYAAGGSVAVAVLGLARTLPTLVGVPLASALGDRAPRARVLLLMDLIAFGASAASAFALAMNASIVAIFALAAVTAVSSAAIRPLQNSIIPELARSPEELVASNVVTSAGEGIGVLVGPAVAAILLTFGPAAAATAGALGMLAACLAVIRIQPTRVPVGHEHHVARARPGVLAGFRALRGLPGPRLIIAVFGVQPFIRGALTVLTVAASIELLGLGEPGVGILNSAAGAGGIVGAVATLALVGRPRMAGFFWLGLILWGVPVTVMGLVPWAPVALIAMAVIGAGNALLDVAGFTILQRIVPNQVRTSVLGVFEADVAAMAGLGGLVAPVLISLFDIRGALIVTGAILPIDRDTRVARYPPRGRHRGGARTTGGAAAWRDHLQRSAGHHHRTAGRRPRTPGLRPRRCRDAPGRPG